MRGGGLEPEKWLEMIEEFRASVAPCGVDWPPGGQSGIGARANGFVSRLTQGREFDYVFSLGIGSEADYT